MTGGFAIDNLTNGLTLRRQLVRDGAIMQSTTDTEVILHLVAKAKRDRFIEGLRQLEGIYAFVGLTNKKLINARDPFGIRPLIIGMLDGHPDPRLGNLCARHHRREIRWRRGEREVAVFDDEGMHSHKPFPPMAARPCIFEYIYSCAQFDRRRPQCLRHAQDGRGTRPRGRGGRRRGDPGPRSPIPASLRPLVMPRNRRFSTSSASSATTVRRTFIEPTQHIRQLAVRLKHSANRAVVDGKRIVLIDGSIVRGTTSVKIAQMMREAGAKEVHFRVASPPTTASPATIPRRCATRPGRMHRSGNCRCSPRRGELSFRE